MRLIDADALKELALWEIYDNSDWDYQYVTTAQIDNAPTIEAEPTKHGRWIDKWHTFFHEEVPTCSECDKWSPLKYKYCPNCGAKMESTMGQLKPTEAVNEEAEDGALLGKIAWKLLKTMAVKDSVLTELLRNAEKGEEK